MKYLKTYESFRCNGFTKDFLTQHQCVDIIKDRLAELNDMGYQILMNTYPSTDAETRTHNVDILEMEISNKENCIVVKAIIDNIVSMASELAENSLIYYGCVVKVDESVPDTVSHYQLENQNSPESLYDMEKFHSIESFTLFFDCIRIPDVYRSKSSSNRDALGGFILNL